jgi:serpin B
VQSLTGEHLQNLLKEPQDIKVSTSLPKFKAEFKADLSEVLKTMGMVTPFVKGLEGVGTSTEDIYMAISRVMHKSFISVDEKGTKAGAATAVMMVPTSDAPPQEYKEVYLDRPFVYMIVDNVTNIPIFIGTVMDMES